jgi:hypothetical protein
MKQSSIYTEEGVKGGEKERKKEKGTAALCIK